MSYKIKKYSFIGVSILMCIFIVMGIISLFVVPAEAKRAQEELEQKIMDNQKLAEERKQKQLELIQVAPSVKEKEKSAEDYYRPASEIRITFIGDSVTLAALPALYEELPNAYIDAVFGRTIFEGIETLRWLEENNQLGEVLIFSLGTNSYISEENIMELINLSHGLPTFWLSTYGVSNDSNQVTKNVIQRYDNAFYIDWESVAKTNPSAYISTDGLHPTEEGSKVYAKLIADTVADDLSHYYLEKRKNDNNQKN